MKITKAFIFVEIDGDEKLRQVLLSKDEQDRFISLIEYGAVMQSPIKISEKHLDTIEVAK